LGTRLWSFDLRNWEQAWGTEEQWSELQSLRASEGRGQNYRTSEPQMSELQ